MSFKPMLASPAEAHQLLFPCLWSPKLDGVRCMVINGRAVSRNLKPFPNPHIQATFGREEFEGFDGELIIGSPTDKRAFINTAGPLQSLDGKPPAVFYTFDVTNERLPFVERYMKLSQRVKAFGNSHPVSLVPHYEVRNLAELLAAETHALETGFEGLITRSPDGPYKFGRSTVREGWMLKFKRFADGEAEILEVIEEMRNDNEAFTDELGRTKRSSAKANLSGKGRMGALRVRDVATGQTFNIGIGFNDDDKAWFWKNRERVPGTLVKYSHFPIGAKDLPRFPKYGGVRPKWDL